MALLALLVAVIRRARITAATLVLCPIAFGQSLGSNPVLTSGSQTINATLSFSGTYSISGTVYMGANVSAPSGSTFSLLGSGSSLNYNSGGPFTLTLSSGTSLTRSGAGYSYIYDGIANNGNLTVSGGTLQFQGGATLTNNFGATTNVTGSGSILTLSGGFANTGNLIADSGGSIQLAGNFTTANLGNIALTGSTPGVVQITGNLDNSGNTLTKPSGGVYTVSGGTIKNGAVNSSAIGFSNNSGSALSNVTVSGDIVVAGQTNGGSYTDQYVTLTNNTSINGNLTVGTAGQYYGTVYLGSDLSLTAGHNLTLTGTDSVLGYYYTTSNLTLPATAGLVRTGAGYSYVYTNLANSGNIVVNGGTLYLSANLTNTSSGSVMVSNGANLNQNSSPYAFTNAGTANVTGASSVFTLHNLTNTGNLIADSGGVLQLAGNFTTAGLGNIVLTGSTPGVVQITGNLDASPAALTAPTGGTYTLYGGTIKNGTVNGSALSFSNNSGSTLSNVTVSGDIVIAGQTNGGGYTDQYVVLSNNTVLNGNLTVGTAGQYYGTVYLGSDLSLTAGHNLTLTGTDSAFGYYYTTTNLTLPATANLVRSGAGYSYVYTNLANSGNIVVNGGTLYVHANLTNTNTGSIVVSNGASLNQNSSAYTFTNAGTANVTGAGSIFTLYNLTNTGNLIADSGGVLQLAGNFTTAGLGHIALTGSTLGVVQITGNLDASPAALTAPAGGTYTLYGGTIKNGTVNGSALSFSNNSGSTLSNVTVSGDIVVAGQTNGGSYTDQYVTLTNNTSINGNLTVGTAGQYYGTVYLGSDLSLTAGHNLTLTGTDSVLGYYYTTSNLTLPATAGLVRTGAGYSYVYTNLANSGNIVVNGGTLYLSANLTNTSSGSVMVSNGANLNQNSSPYAFTNAGTANVTGASSVFTLHNLTNTGNLIADSGGVLQLAGNFTTAGLGNIVLTGSTPGVVQITGNLDASPAALTAPTGGTYTLYGGTIKNGTVNGSALSFSNNSGSTLSNVTVSGDIVIAGQTNGGGYTDQYVVLSNNTVLNGNLTVGTAGQYYGTVYLGSDLSLTAGHNLTLTGTDSAFGYYYTTTNLTLPATANLVRSGAGYSYVYTNLANSGNIVVNGGTLYVHANLTNTNTGSIVVSNGASLNQNSSAYTFTNAGTANVTGAGSVLTLYNLTNTGNLVADLGGVLQLAGNFTTAGLGHIALTGSTLGAAQITGNLDNSGANLSAPSGGAYSLQGGVITNGTVTSSALSFSHSGGTLDNTTVNGDITIAGGANYTDQSLTLQNGTTINGNITVGTAGQYYGSLQFGSNLALAANRTLTLTGIDSALGYYYTSATVSIPATASLVRTGTDYSYVYANLNNAGTISISGGTLYLDANLNNAGNVIVSNGAILNQSYSSTAFTNTGTVNVTGAGSVLTLYNLTNTGNLVADSTGVLQLAGNFTTGNLGNIAITGGKPGAVQITGTLDNTGATLGAPTGGAYTLYGGTIKNGTITSAALAFSNDIGTLDNATVNGDITIAGGPNYTDQYLLLQNNTAINGNITIGTAGQSSGTLYLGSDLALAANHNLTLTGSASSLNSYYNQPTLTIPATAGLLRTGAGYSYVYDTVANSGNIVVNGGTLYLDANLTNSGSVLVSSGASLTASSYYTTVFLNQGTANVTGAGSTLTLYNLTNTGNLIADSGGVLQLAGNFTTAGLGNISLTGATPGLVRLTGTLDNTGATLAAPAGGIYTLYGGTLRNGTVAGNALTFSNNGGTIDNATLNGDVTIGAPSQYVYFVNNTTVTGNLTLGTPGQSGGVLYLGSDLTPAANTTVTLTGSSSYLGWTGSARQLTLGPANTLLRTGAGYGTVADSIVNSGTVSVTGGSLYTTGNVTNQANITVAAGTQLYSSSSPQFTQSAGVFRIDGTFNPPSTGLNISGGSLTGAGTIGGNVTFTAGTLDPGSSIGTLTFSGNLTLSSSTITNLELGAGTNDRIVMTGSYGLVFGGQLNILAVSTAFTSGQTWNLFNFTAHTGSFSSINLPYTANGWVWDTSQLLTTGNLTLTTFVPVPEPSTYALLATGLGALFFVRRRRR
jgi:hypothetical protein